MNNKKYDDFDDYYDKSWVEIRRGAMLGLFVSALLLIAILALAYVRAADHVSANELPDLLASPEMYEYISNQGMGIVHAASDMQ